MKVYYNENGSIYACVKGDASIPNLSFIECKDSLVSFDGEYVNIETKLLEHRPNFALSVDKTELTADNKDEVTITNIPVGTVCNYENENHTINDGEIKFSCDIAGEYILKFSLWPYIDFSLTLTGVV